MMRLDVVLKRAGVTIVKADKGEKRISLFLRVAANAPSREKWKKVIEELLLAMAEKSNLPWGADVSKAFFADNGAVKYLWRVVLTGDVKQAAESFGAAVLRAVTQTGVEITSMPLVGQVAYENNPAEGKTKGGHDRASAQKAIGAFIGAR